MKTILLTTFLTTVTISCVAEAKVYTPLSALEDVPVSTQRVFASVKPEARPFLPGMRPIEVELLEDALRRKQSRTIGASREKARASIVRNFLRSPIKRAHMKGMLAEALYLEKNPQWGYVRSPTASQHDIYTRIAGRIFYGQIKTHASTNPSVYARDMLEDRRSDLFIVPDDHVAPLRELWRMRVHDLESRGLVTEAGKARRQFFRVRSLGFSAKGLDDRANVAGRYCIREHNAAYISLGAGIAMAFGPDLWEWWRTGSLSQPAMIHMTRAVSILAAERAATFALAKYGTGALQGSVQGNVIVGLVILGVDTGYSIYENGGSKAFHSATFYTHLGGSIGGISLGLAVGGPVGITATEWAAPTGLWAPVIGAGAGFAAGTAAGAVGYIAGESASRKILEAVNPAFLHDAENAVIRDARKHLAASIVMLQRDSLVAR